ncbi:MAG: hypothetical protein ACLFV7_14350, partial [Phycisphaerae bacterium]
SEDSKRATGGVDLAAALYISGRIALARGRRERARSAWERAAGLLKELADAGKLDQQPDWQALQESVLGRLGELGPPAEGGTS